MANYKRGKCRFHGRTTLSQSFLRSYPRWHDIVFHHRPHRQATKALARAVIRGDDPDAVSWPLRHKPHKYYW